MLGAAVWGGGAGARRAGAAEAGSERDGRAAGTVRKGAVAVGTAARRYGLAARNAARQRRKARLDYVLVPIEGPLAERDARPRPFPLNRLPFLARRPVSLAELRRRVDTLAADPRVRGVVFDLRQPPPGLAGAEALRGIFARAKRRGLETVAYLTEVSLASYFAATACDRVVALPAGEFNALGLHLSATFLRDTFARAGLRFEVIAVSPYKAAGDSLTRRDMSPEQRQNLDWLLDDLYGHVVGTLAADRGLTPERVRALLNGAPFDLQHAVEVGLLDATLFEDGLGDYLGSDGEPAAVVTWERTAARLVVPFRPRPERVIAVLTVAGMIVEGRRPSATPVAAAGAGAGRQPRGRAGATAGGRRQASGGYRAGDRFAGWLGAGLCGDCPRGAAGAGTETGRGVSRRDGRVGWVLRGRTVQRDHHASDDHHRLNRGAAGAGGARRRTRLARRGDRRAESWSECGAVPNGTAVE